MKVLEINSATYGSTGTIVKDLSFELKKRGHEVLFAYGRGQKPKSIESYKIGTKFSIFIHVVLSRIFDLSGFGSKISTKKFLKQIDKFKPDVVHLHNLHGHDLTQPNHTLNPVYYCLLNCVSHQKGNHSFHRTYVLIVCYFHNYYQL